MSLQYPASYALLHPILKGLMMATVEIIREHTLGKEVAKERAQQLAEKLTSKLDVVCSWQEDELTFQRSGVDGSIQVGEANVHIAIKLGVMLLPMAGMVKSEIEKALNRYLV